MKKNTQEIAQLLDRAAFSASSVQQISVNQAISIDEAYEIQEKSLNERYKRGEVITGVKLGFTSRAKMEQMGVHELIWGRLTDHMEFCLEDTLPLDKFIHPRAEPEIAFKLSKDITEAISLSNVGDYISAVAGAIEIIDSRYENFKFSLEDVIADNCSSSGYVIGEWLLADTKVGDLTIDLQINGESVQTGNSNAILGNPLESLVEASIICNKYGLTLKKDMIVLAGAATPAQYIHKGDSISAIIEGLGTIKINA